LRYEHTTTGRRRTDSERLRDDAYTRDRPDASADWRTEYAIQEVDAVLRADGGTVTLSTSGDRVRDREHDTAGDPDGERGLPPELSEVQRRLRTRLEESCSVDVDVREGEAVLVAEKLGDEHVIHPDGRVEGGAVAGRLGDVAAEFLGGGE
jgi:hypothetical protein